MTQEEKQLLLKDLCARLPYGVIVKVEYYDASLKDAHIFEDIVLTIGNINKLPVYWVSAKPYLRPMSSMTEEEKRELYNIRPYFINSDDIVSGTQCNTFMQASECQDWLNAHQFDYRGLIPMGLALEAKEGMYKTE